MKSLLFTIVAVVSLASVRGEDREQTIKQLLRNIRTELPKGWSASYDKKDACLKIARDEEVFMLSALPNSPGGIEPEKSKFVFSFRAVKVMQPDEYRRLSGENAKIQTELHALYQQLVKKGVSHKFDSFSPETAEDKTAVARYEALKKSRHDLPDFYFNDISLEWLFNSPNNPILFPADEKTSAECIQVQEKVVRLFSKYETP